MLSLLTAPTATPGSAAIAAATDNTVRQQSFLNAYSSHLTAPTSVAVIRSSAQPTTAKAEHNALPSPAARSTLESSRWARTGRAAECVTKCRCTRLGNR